MRERERERERKRKRKRKQQFIFRPHSCVTKVILKVLFYKQVPLKATYEITHKQIVNKNNFINCFNFHL